MVDNTFHQPTRAGGAICVVALANMFKEANVEVDGPLPAVHVKTLHERVAAQRAALRELGHDDLLDAVVVEFVLAPKRIDLPRPVHGF